MPCILQVNPNAPEAELLAEAAEVVRRGGLVAFPTETVYGLAADATNPNAIERLNQVKGRAPDKPYSIHLSDAAEVASFVVTIPPLARRLMERFWPGPLTIVIPGKDGKTVGFRVPNHPVAQAFLRICRVPVVAPSANRSGTPPPTDGREVLTALGDDVELLLDAGPTSLGRESTVVEVIGERLEILREGAIAEELLRVEP